MLFPAVLLGHDGSIEIIKHERQLKVCGKSALSNKFYEKASLIDSNRDIINFDDIQLEKNHGWFSGFSIFSERKVEISFQEIKVVEGASLLEVVQKIINCMKVDEYFWESTGSIESIEKELLESSDFSHLIEVLSRYL
ncbi:hypothetical protein R1T43_01290 [Alteromonas sp. CI.11.F.A3]|uniref:hypothetical protein n=1 Tax=Alteromonas sp. CI.11.F.A3 TaxID=3079555 RepID=UPI002943F2A5|nr:hypothetical protein [Alteromonas sp. CI.11.F.A3]WOI37700.1 hypothetical protein R1T43_01290 [Alteromonas sp. CI.11.F.A3]